MGDNHAPGPKKLRLVKRAVWRSACASSMLWSPQAEGAVRMKCPHCGIDFHEDWQTAEMLRKGKSVLAKIRGYEAKWGYATTRCSKCGNVTIKIGATTQHGTQWEDWRTVYPIGTNRGPVSPEVPSAIATDYIEACTVLPFSAKASAALSRRCLQAILHDAGYRGRDLNAEIDLLLNEADPKKAIPARLRDTVDTIRHFGNFSAHHLLWLPDNVMDDIRAHLRTLTD
jgi:hypothetical protein